MSSGQNWFFAQTGKENTRMRMKIVIYFVNDENVMQKQGVLNFDQKDQQSTCSLFAFLEKDLLHVPVILKIKFVAPIIIIHIKG